MQILYLWLKELDNETKKALSKASLGNSSRDDIVGKPIIAAGSILGAAGSQIHGFITSDSIEEQMADRNLHLLTTDIYGSTEASGVLIDYNGRILGIITTLYPAAGAENLITAYSISDIKFLIEQMANSLEPAYLGIYGTDVTVEAANTLGVPIGAYVTGVVPGSPAMAAGIQGGDVITKIGKDEIINFSDYMRVLEKNQPKDKLAISIQRYVRGAYIKMTFEVMLGGDSERRGERAER